MFYSSSYNCEDDVNQEKWLIVILNVLTNDLTPKFSVWEVLHVTPGKIKFALAIF